VVLCLSDPLPPPVTTGTRAAAGTEAIASIMRQEGLTAVMAAYEWVWTLAQSYLRGAEGPPPTTPLGPEVRGLMGLL
jgi:hypothetical protein